MVYIFASVLPGSSIVATMRVSGDETIFGAIDVTNMSSEQVAHEIVSYAISCGLLVDQVTFCVDDAKVADKMLGIMNGKPNVFYNDPDTVLMNVTRLSGFIGNE